jgi:hypothetical protein
MNFIDYVDEFGEENFFDASKVMFTMTTQDGPVDEYGQVQATLTKVALCEGMGFILTKEKPSSIIKRIKEAMGID